MFCFLSSTIFFEISALTDDTKGTFQMCIPNKYMAASSYGGGGPVRSWAKQELATVMDMPYKVLTDWYGGSVNDEHFTIPIMAIMKSARFSHTDMLPTEELPHPFPIFKELSQWDTTATEEATSGPASDYSADTEADEDKSGGEAEGSGGYGDDSGSQEDDGNSDIDQEQPQTDNSEEVDDPDEVSSGDLTLQDIHENEGPDWVRDPAHESDVGVDRSCKRN